jgi:hypothetical protein
MKRHALLALIVCGGLALALMALVPAAPGPAPAAQLENAAAPAARPVPEKSIVDQDAPYMEACAREGLNQAECVGRLIWFKATAGNDRFHTYTFQQRIGVMIDWFRVLRSDERDDRFRAWGIINDPACCIPGDPDCPAKNLNETYGFDWCPGDDVLLKYVGKPGYLPTLTRRMGRPISGSRRVTSSSERPRVRWVSASSRTRASIRGNGVRSMETPRPGTAFARPWNRPASRPMRVSASSWIRASSRRF